MKAWQFDLPWSLRNQVRQKVNPEEVSVENGYDDYELRVHFESDALCFVKSAYPIAEVTKFRYFEVEVVENKSDSQVFIGICDSWYDSFSNTPDRVTDLTGPTM